jgi:cell division protein ZapA (FtsZ GTPase activity inhibitor)
MAGDGIALDRHIGYLTAINIVDEIGKGESRLRSTAGRGLEKIEKSDEKQPDYDPQGEILAEIVHV